MRQLIVGLYFILAAFTSMAQSELTPRQEKRAELCRHIYHNIAKVMADNRQPPAFIFRPNHSNMPYYVTHFNPKNNTIVFGEGIYDIAVTMGADSINALALTLGHELAHFYKDHHWGMAFGTANEDMEISKKIYDIEITPERKAALEAEADYYGSVCAYLAGYQVFDVGPAFVKAYYEIGLPDEVFGYPTKQERIKTIEGAQEKIAASVPILDAARLLAYQGAHDLAAHCYANVAQEFPNKVLYNNAGVNYALAARRLMKDSVKFYYPFTLDLTNLQQDQTGKKRAVMNNSEKVTYYLKMSEKMLNKALDMDEQYVPAMLNLALALDLAGNYEMAWAYAVKAERNKSSGMEILPNIFVAKGIIAHHNNNKADAKRMFDLAASKGSYYGKENMNVLRTGQPYRKKEIAHQNINVEEQISGLSPQLASVLKEGAKVSEVKYQGEDQPGMKIYTVKDQDYEAVLVSKYKVPRKEFAFVTTPKGYEGKTGAGLIVGDSVGKILSTYGEPEIKLSNLGEEVYVYNKPTVIFYTRYDRLIGWTLYLK